MLLPADLWLRSTVTERDLWDLVDVDLLHEKADRDRPEWKVPLASHRVPKPPDGYVVSFTAFHARGFGMPSSRFIRAILHHYEIELHQHNPNSITQAASLWPFARDF